MAARALQLLGPPRLKVDGTTLDLGRRKSMAFLAYLAVTREHHGREALLVMFWPEYDEARARANLRRTLSATVATLGPRWLSVEGDTIALARDAGLRVDVHEFRRSIERARRHCRTGEPCSRCRKLLTAAVCLYRGDFMQGFFLRDSSPFDDWQAREAHVLRRDLAVALKRLAEAHHATGEWEAAIEYARQWLALDPVEEAAHRTLMRLYEASGAHAAAVRQYQDCARSLREELGVDPTPETSALYRSILARPASASVGPRAAATAAPAAGLRIVTAVVISTRPDAPGDPRAAFAAFETRVRPIFERYGAKVRVSRGADLVGLFGVEQTREDETDRAIRAALEITRVGTAAGLASAAGIDTGPSYAPGEAERRSQASVSVVRRSERLAHKALPGQVLVGRSGRWSARTAFRFEECGRGGPAGSRAYRVLPPAGRTGDGQASFSAVFVAREAELQALGAVIDGLAEGRGRLVSLVGEAGVGKSRLMAEIRSRVAAKNERVLWFEGRCSEMRSTTSYWPFLEITRCLFGSERPGPRLRERVRERLAALSARGFLDGARCEEVAAVIAGLFSLPPLGPAEQALGALAQEDARRRAFAGMRDLMQGLARSRPVVIVVEDLHWADSLSLDLVGSLADLVRTTALALILVYRPGTGDRCSQTGTVAERRCPGLYTEIRLRELSRQESLRILQSIDREKRLRLDWVEAILHKTQGNPFFLEESVRACLESPGDDKLELLPPTVHRAVQSRADRLRPDARHVLRVASVVGARFGLALLERLVPPALPFEESLSDLVAAGFLYEDAAHPEPSFSFKHVLAQEAIYESISVRAREEIHGRIVGALESLYADSLDEHCAELAFHCEESSQIEDAIRHHKRAGEKSARSCAYAEASRHFSRSLDLLRSLPADRDRDRREMDLLAALGIPLSWTRGLGSDEVGRVYRRALELCESCGDPVMKFEALHGLRLYCFAAGDAEEESRLVHALLGVAWTIKDCAYAARAHFVLAQSAIWHGRLAAAVAHTSDCSRSADPERSRDDTLRFGTDSLGNALMLRGLALAFLGCPTQGRQLVDEGLSTARTIGYDNNMALALFYASVFSHALRDHEQAAGLARSLRALAEELRSSTFLAPALAIEGWALAGKGDSERSVATIREGVDVSRGVTKMWSAFCWMTLGDALQAVGRPRESREALTESLRIVDEAAAYWMRAEALRLLGRALLELGEVRQAQRSWLDALDVARSQSARLWEVRIALDLARSWLSAGREQEAQSMLAEVCGAAPEATGDSLAAHELLQNLSGTVFAGLRPRPTLPPPASSG